MKKRNKVFASILCAMILASSLATPAFAAERESEDISDVSIIPANPGEQETEGEELEVISETTRQLPLTEPNMVEHKEITTKYEGDVETVTVLKGYGEPVMARAWVTMTEDYTATTQVKENGQAIAMVKMEGRFRFDRAAKKVERLPYRSSMEIYNNNKYKKDYLENSIDTGTYWGGTTWAYARANFRIVAGATNWSGYAELRCDSNGKVTTPSKVFRGR